MIRTSPNNNEANEQAPPQGNSTTQKEAAGSNKPSKLASSSSTPRASTSAAAVAPWTRLSKDPRIVRVSRAFGGKDRHSKVCTVRGLRDRRVRLSVPTAIQLYDLQDRLGLNQPSKAVDWLLDAAKDDIDQLPPLPMIPSIPGSYEVMSHHATLDQNLWRSRNNDNEEDQEKLKDGEEESDEDEDHGKQVRNSNVIHHGSSSSSNHPLFFSGLLNNTNAMPGYVFNNWDQSQSSNFPLHAQLGGYRFTPHNFNVVSSLPSELSLLTGATQSYFPPHATADAADHRVDVSRHFEQHMGSSHENFLANSVYPSGNSMQRRETPQNLMGMITKIVHSNSEPNKDHEPRSS